MATISPIGIEPREVDLTPIHSGGLTELDKAELKAFFLEQRARNDRDPVVVRLRQQLEAKKGKKPVVRVGFFSGIAPLAHPKPKEHEEGKKPGYVLYLAPIEQHLTPLKPVRGAVAAKKATSVAKAVPVAKAAAKRKE